MVLNQIKRTVKKKCKITSTIICCLLAASAFSVLLFLIPFIIDPAMATILADFSKENVSCRVSEATIRFGPGNCSWSSCREGCTREIYTCFQVKVEYETLESQNKSAILFVNARGCGYPPDVKCESFFEQYHYDMVNNRTFNCSYSRKNNSIVVTKVDVPQQSFNLALSVLIPCIVLVISCIALVVIQKYIDFEKEPIFEEGCDVHSQIDENDSETILSSSGRTENHLDGILRKFVVPSSATTTTPLNEYYQETLKRKSDHIELPTLSKRIRRAEIDNILTNYIVDDEARMKTH